MYSFLAVILVLVIVVQIGTIHAQTYTLGSHSIGIVLSKTCMNMNRASIDSTCPTYEDLVSLDTSNRKYSGDFGKINGVYQRLPSDYKTNSWNLYAHDKTPIIFVDPPKEYWSRMPLITIEPSMEIYKDNKDRAVKDYLVIQYKDRYINERCNNARMSSTNWQFLLPDTLFIMWHKCQVKGQFDEKISFKIELTEHDISTSQKWKDEQRQKYIIENCLKEYGKCKD